MRSYSSLADLHSSASPSFGHHRSAHSDNNVLRMSTADDIQSHLFSAFLSGRTADVTLRVRGTWEGVYRLHRVVLIQAGFFRSLFDGGFREATGKHGREGEVSITFDDPNITRPAFEICISRLYGGGPALFVDPRLCPSRREPLTSCFPQALPPNNTPAGHYNATPRFLLSLLATAIYLSIPTLVAQAIQLALSSLGPRTVIRYLNFAIGKGIGEKTEEDSETVPGLENICQEVRSPGSIRSKSVRSGASKRSKAPVSRTVDSHAPPQKEAMPNNDPHTDASDSDAETDMAHEDADDGPAFMYGAASNKIGEAAACWLCRWGADMLAYEEAAESADVSSIAGHGQEQTGPSRRRATVLHEAGPPSFNSIPRETIPLIWRRGGMDAKWACAVLSSDAFFVRDEWDRYDLARKVVELRRKVSIEPTEEREWDNLFANGIHYMHMSLNELIEISQDVSPTNGRPYASASVIQAAHWNQSVLRHHITYKQNASSPGTPPRSPNPARDGCLGLSQTTAEIIEEHNGSSDAHKTYYRVPVDSSSRIGDTTGLEGASMDQLFGSPAPTTPSSPTTKTSSVRPFSAQSINTFFGILSVARDAAACAAADTTGQATWAPFPPIRFGVEFWGLDSLQEKSRLTSQTIWYAGSLFNVYIQVVRKKGLQLGMYVHRLSSVETIPIPSAPPIHVPGGGGEERRWTIVQPVNIPSSVSTPSLYRPASRGGATATSAPSRSPTPASSYSPPSTTSGGSTGTSPSGSSVPSAHQTSPRPPTQPYRDPREAVRAHFTLLCMSPTGGVLTTFASAPDAFVVGRSWGWKSSTLQTEELVDVHTEGDTSPVSAASSYLKRECSLRATVVLGVV
ncbi:uncharacterized protein FOMMEDRAFT_167607 [Fomitiporia mediterranea MF3/22]|uniref:uncharacterized protein n=1 Tax=Fomitiporia mediterranea (strain MF3/22) TaxID=694068 RepID=UPI0004409BD0|nr:uncharacterized protein FOMMEDRAFT_167607 [Fomitiporia mediterranea MF3/22]EJD04415.1 hypothetical protein FOMMEDRAFT_167607 [Fomitiporia mediterranea MF3/22]